MIEQSIVEFLTNPEQDGQRADRFDARTTFRERIGTNINISRRPPNDEVDYGATVLRISDERYNDLGGESCLQSPVIQIDVYGKGPNAAATVLKLGETILRAALSNYHGQMGDLYVRGCTLERGVMQASAPPRDKSENWTHRFSSDYRITHDQNEILGGS